MDGAVGPPGPMGRTGPPGAPDPTILSRLSSVEKVADTLCSKYGPTTKIVTDVSLSYTGYLSVKTVSCPFR